MNKIPKILHYCWLSGDPKPQFLQECLDSWTRHMPDYEIICWDMDRFDINSVQFVKDACAAKKWAYACDYIRLYALYTHGGIYMDLDVMVYKSFDPFLKHSAFSSIEFWPEHFYESLKQGSTSGLGIEAAVLGAEAKHPWIKACMDIYGKLKFDPSSEIMSSLIMSGKMAEVSERFGFRYEPVYQVLQNDVHLYPPDVFSKQCENNVVKYATHFCANSWRNATELPKKKKGIKQFLKYKLIGEKNWDKIRRSIKGKE